MFGPDPREKFLEDVNTFNYSAAFRQFIKDNFLFCFILLTAGIGAAVFNGARSTLSNKKVGTIILAVMVCRAFHAGMPKKIIIIEKETTDDNPTDTV